MNTNEIIICVGISGSGKSTWTTDYIKQNSNYLRINRDDIRKTLVGDLNGYYQRKDLNTIEQEINDIEDFLFERICNINKIPIIDNTNLKISYINKWIKKCVGWNSYSSEIHDYPLILDFKFKLFDISLEEAKDRVIDRELYYQWGELFDRNKELAYIDKQYFQYQEIKKYLETNYKDKIIQ